MKVLALSAKVDDPSFPLVAARLAERGAELRVLDTGRLPAELSLSLGIGEAPPPTALGDGLLDGVGSIWIRHVETGRSLPDDLPDDHRATCRAQADAALWSLIGCSTLFQLDPPEALLSVYQKPRVVAMAHALGLTVPRTLITNDPAALQRFAATCPTGVVCKLVENSGISQADGRPLLTSLLSPEEIADPQGLSLSPMCFQERVLNEEELRITVVGRQAFVAALRPGELIDWRGSPEAVASVRPFQGLPEAVLVRIFRLLDQMGLNFATVDLIHTPDGRWVFLEVNSVSFFDHVERHAGLPISAAVADLLLGRAPPRVGRRLDGAL
jgi:hypothetical protein